MHNLELIPEPRHDAVRVALQSMGCQLEHTEFCPLKGGVSGALIMRYEAHSRPYVLRIEPERIMLKDRERGFACMVAAAAVGAAPAVHYADAATGIAIIDFIAGRPLATFPGGPVPMARALGALVKTVQATAPFTEVGDYRDAIGRHLENLATSRFITAGQLNQHIEGLARIRAELSWDPSTLVSAHNDINPRNLLFDGERIWLIDWELAFLNDPLVDIAILTTEVVQTPVLTDVLLEAAFGAPPDYHLRARLSVIRLLTRLFYGCIVLDSLVGKLPFPPDVGRAASSPDEFRAALVDGRLASGSIETAYAFGMMSLAAFADGLVEPGFADTLNLAAKV